MNWEETKKGSLGMAVRLQQKRSRKKRSLKSQPPHRHGLFLKDKHFKSFAPRGIKSKQPIKNLEIFLAKFSMGFNRSIPREGRSQSFKISLFKMVKNIYYNVKFFLK